MALTVTMSDVVLQRMLNGEVSVERDDYRNMDFIRFEQLCICPHKEGVFISFHGSDGVSLFEINRLIPYEDACHIDISGRIPITMDKI